MKKIKSLYTRGVSRFKIPFWLLAIIYFLLFFSPARAGVLHMEITDVFVDHDRTLVRWSVMEESLAMYYSLERSTDGIEYLEVHQQPGSNPSAGTHVNSYEAADNNSVPGIFYYRVKRVDVNGNAEYSDTIPFKSTGSFTGIEVPLEVHPNPFVDHFLIRLVCGRSEEVEVGVFSPEGVNLVQLYTHCEKGPNLIPVSLNGRLKGRYCMVRVVSRRTGEVYCCRALGL